MAYIEGFKTSDNFSRRGLGNSLLCCHCSSVNESHKHLFFECLFTWNMIKTLLPYGNFFMLEPSLHQVLHQAQFLGHKVIKRIYLLIVTTMIYIIWKERNARLVSKDFTTFKGICCSIKSLVAHKLRRWNFKSDWPEHVSTF